MGWLRRHPARVDDRRGSVGGNLTAKPCCPAGRRIPPRFAPVRACPSRGLHRWCFGRCHVNCADCLAHRSPDSCTPLRHFHLDHHFRCWTSWGRRSSLFTGADANRKARLSGSRSLHRRAFGNQCHVLLGNGHGCSLEDEARLAFGSGTAGRLGDSAESPPRDRLRGRLRRRLGCRFSRGALAIGRPLRIQRQGCES